MVHCCSSFILVDGDAQAAEVRQKDMNLAGHNLIHQLKAALEDFDKADQGQGGAMGVVSPTLAAGLLCNHFRGGCQDYPGG